jgi:hypothetical protein
MKKQGNGTPPKVYNSLITESKDTEMVKMPDKEFKSLVLKMTNDLKEDSSKQINEVRQSIQDMAEKFIRDHF